ncbi:MAG: type I DNA topoisomerase [Clostridia bacterium]|nr:type I DNA topoisomerase [Clostridia bacterium]
MQKLVIVESPTKAPAIKGYLGSGYKVVASKGHVRDLPKSSLGIDIDNNFEAHYINIRGKGDLIRELKKEAKAADKVFLATDPDREGEAISWHLVNALGIDAKKVNRITFNELTKTAVKEAVKHPREIDMNLVNSQQARRILDRIVGYKLSPFLWKTVRSGLSAGRVQSVATRIVVERENEIRAFVPTEYWTVDANLLTEEGKSFKAGFYGLASDSSKIELKCESDAMAVVDETTRNPFNVRDVKKGKKYRHPAPPFITSTLQQEASRKLNFQSQRTMKVAQELYEGINLGHEFGGVQGLITYMRTDSLRIADEARNAAKEYITEVFGNKYYPESPRVYKTKAGAQDAHEAIRPTHVNIEPKAIKSKLSSDQYRLYKLIWDRFISSQMESAELSTVQVDITCGKYLFRSSGYTVKFPGFMAVYEESTDDGAKEKSTRLPQIGEGETLGVESVEPAQHFTEPPARYTEASLIKFLEEKGIGRPSTYTSIITLIVSRGYVKRQGKTLHPTSLGEIITKLMCERFPDIVDYRFTAMMEDRLDSIEEGDVQMNDVLAQFYGGFEKELNAALESVSKDDIELPVEQTDIVCDKCGAKMIIKEGRFGRFAACPNYPECKNTKPITKDGKEKTESSDVKVEGMKCELCGSDVVLRNGRYGSFYACSSYPKCKFTKQIAKNLGVKCPDCGGEVVIKYGKNKSQFYSCEKYPDCKFSSWDMPTNKKCPVCGDMLMSKKGKNLLVCRGEKCGYKTEAPADGEE